MLTVSKREVSVDIGAAATPDTESLVRTTLGLCLSKGDRFDWAIQKATELGVSAIAPLYSERVDFSIPPDRTEKRVAHWQQIAISACEQCGRVRIPAVSTPQPLEQWVQSVAAEHKWVLHCDYHGAPKSVTGIGNAGRRRAIDWPRGRIGRSGSDTRLREWF